MAVRDDSSWQPRGWRGWSLSRRVAVLALIVVVGSIGAFAYTLLEAAQPTLAKIGLVVAMLACGALGYLGIEWYYSLPPRR